jgi:putative membrane protein
MATLYLILALLIAIVAVIFALQNTAAITISFFMWKVTGSLSLVLLVTLAIGVLIGLLVLAPAYFKNTFQVSSHRKRLSALEKELDEHKQSVARLAAEKEKLNQAISEATASAKPPAK